MTQMETDTERIVAVLHDVTEDTAYTITQIANFGLTEEIRDALVLLDKNNHSGSDKEERYVNMIAAIKEHSIARKVKIKDLEHNMDLRRIINRHDMRKKDMERVGRYMKAWSYLTGE